MTDQGNQNENYHFKLAAIQMLGLFMEKLNPRDIQDDDVNLMWNTMLNNITPENIELTQIVSKAIARLAPATVKNFQNPDQQQKIMEGIFSLLMINDDDVLRQTLECLIDIIRINYVYMGQYLEKFNQIWEAFFDNQTNEKIAEFSIEIWNTLFEGELDNMETQNPLRIIYNSDWKAIAIKLLGGLTKTNMQEDGQGLDEENENSISLKCQIGLGNLAPIVRNDLFEFQFGHVQELLG